MDPHGDTVERLLEYVPRNRTNQVVYLSLADEEFPAGLNFLQPRADQPNHLVVSELVSSIRHLWADSWGCNLSSSYPMFEEPCNRSHGEEVGYGELRT